MQETLFEQQLFEVKNDGRMLTQTGEQVHDPQMIFKRDATIDHVQQLRTTTYSCLNLIFEQQSASEVKSFCTSTFKYLPKILSKDVMALPKQMRSNKRDLSELDSELNSEAIELLVRLMGKDAQLSALFAQAGVDSSFIGELKSAITEFDLGFENSSAVKDLEKIKL